MDDNVIDYKEYPSNYQKYWNPYHSNLDLSKNIVNIYEHIQNTFGEYITNNIIYILGPRNRIGNQYIYKFMIDLREFDDIFFKMTTFESNYFATLSIKNNYFTKISEDKQIQKKSCELSNVSKNNNNSGKDLVEWAKFIIASLGFTSIYLSDNAYISCPERNKLFNRRSKNTNKNEFPLRALSILKKNVGYYSQFNIIPYIIIRNNKIKFISKKETIESKITELFSKYSWDNFDIFFDKLKKTIDTIKKNNKENIISRKFNGNFDSWKEYFEVIYSNYNYLKENYGLLRSPFHAFEHYKDKICNFFIDWLELFQITYKKYTTENYEIYEENKIEIMEIPGIKILNEINTILSECKWICFSINL